MKIFALYFLPVFLLLSCGGGDSDIAETEGTDSTYCDCNELSFDETYNNFYLEKPRDGFTGDCETFYPNGQVKLQKSFIKGKVDGKLISYYDNGQVEKVAEYEMNLQTGEQINYTPNGVIMFHALYKRGKQVEVIETHPELMRQYGLN